ncbi:MAG: iron chelate uptake ABC transporter family permease subunit [Clostridium sp.]
MKDKRKILILSIIAIFLIAVYVFSGLNEANFTYNISKRIPKIFAISLTGGAIAYASIIFQSVTNNRIVTPSILGLDSLYGFLQTIIVFIFGTSSIFIINPNINFAITTLTMVGCSLLIHRVLAKKGSINIFYLLLVGTIAGTFFRSISTFMQVLMDPNDYESLQNKLFASFSNVNTKILLLSIIIILLIFAFMYEDIKKMDVLLLGRDNAINLGINYDRFSKKILIVVGILISISTALVGPLTFLGIIVVNLSYQMIKTYKHSYRIIASILISIISLVGAQLIVERVLNYNSKVSIIINFVGGIYFIYLLLKESKS